MREYIPKEEIESKLKSRVERIPELVEDGVKFRAPKVQEHAPDTAGCNWSLNVVDGALEPYFGEVTKIVNSLRQQFSIKT